VVRSTGKEEGVACGLPHIIIAARHGLRHRRVAVENQITTNKKRNAQISMHCAYYFQHVTHQITPFSLFNFIMFQPNPDLTIFI